MKRFALIVLSLAVMMALIACSPQPKIGWYSQNAVNGAEKAIEVTDAYLAYDMDADEAIKMLEDIASRIEGGAGERDSSIASRIRSLALLISISDKGEATAEYMEDIQERRDELYDSLYY